MMLQYDLNDKRAIKRLLNSKRFIKYPDMFLSNTCTVKVNNDEYLEKDEFVIKCKNPVLPRRIFIYGKKERTKTENTLYLNYWMKVFLQTIESGLLFNYDLENKNKDLTELRIGLSYLFRMNAFHSKCWNRQIIIKFLECLFNIEVFETNYEQQDLFNELVA